MEGVELRRPVLGNMDVAQVLGNDRPVRTFHSGIVMAGPRTGLSPFNQQRVEQCDHMLMDVLRAVIRMKRENHKREWVEEIGQHRNQGPFTDFLHRTDDFALGHRIHGIDM